MLVTLRPEIGTRCDSKPFEIGGERREGQALLHGGLPPERHRRQKQPGLLRKSLFWVLGFGLFRRFGVVGFDVRGPYFMAASLQNSIGVKNNQVSFQTFFGGFGFILGFGFIR